MVGNLQGKRSFGMHIYRGEIVVKNLIEKDMKM
jgi:hypothetical protein